jgi:hypothetical protein
MGAVGTLMFVPVVHPCLRNESSHGIWPKRSPLISTRISPRLFGAGIVAGAGTWIVDLELGGRNIDSRIRPAVIPAAQQHGLSVLIPMFGLNLLLAMYAGSVVNV